MTIQVNEINLYSWNLSDEEYLKTNHVKQTTQLLADYLINNYNAINNNYTIYILVNNKEYTILQFIQSLGYKYGYNGEINIYPHVENNRIDVYIKPKDNNLVCQIYTERNKIIERDSTENDFLITRIDITSIYTFTPKLIDINSFGYDAVVVKNESGSLYDYCNSDDISIQILFSDVQYLSNIKLNDINFGTHQFFGYTNSIDTQSNCIKLYNDDNNSKDKVFSSVSSKPNEFYYLIKRDEMDNRGNIYYEKIINLFIETYKEFESQKAHSFSYTGFNSLFIDDIAFISKEFHLDDFYDLLKDGSEIYLKGNWNNLFILIRTEFNSDNEKYKLYLNNTEISFKTNDNLTINEFKLDIDGNGVDKTIYFKSDEDEELLTLMESDNLFNFTASDNNQPHLLEYDEFRLYFYIQKKINFRTTYNNNEIKKNV